MKYPKHLTRLVAQLKKLPGVGGKTAERFAFQLLRWSDKELADLSHSLSTMQTAIVHCLQCGALADDQNCTFCQSGSRNHEVLCLVATPREIYAIEETGQYRGLYHVLGGLLSPLDGRGPEKLSIDRLKSRIDDLGVKEVIAAFDSTVEGDATALFLRDELNQMKVKVTRLAFGLPMGSPLEYVDGGTLARALSGRGLA